MTLREQTEVLIDKGYARSAGLSEEAFRALVAPLEEVVPDEPYVLVAARALVPPHVAVTLTALAGRPGFTTMEPEDLKRFVPTGDLDVPQQQAYLVTGVDTGASTRGVRPDDALAVLHDQGRTPLTLEEGLAVVTQHPQWLRERNCFEMLGSRCGDKRVTGLWVSAKAPRLGWCWGGNPHTWLGMASATRRLGAP